MKILFTIILVCFYSISFSQTISESDIKEMAKQINDIKKGLDTGQGIIIRGCFAYGRTVVYQYDVSAYWSPNKTIKEDIISFCKESGTADLYFYNNINTEFCYYYGNKLIKKVTIKSQEFSNLNYDLGEYLSIKGHPKAKGVNLKLKVPIHWEIEEGDRPNVVKKFVFNTNIYMVMVKDNATFYSRNESRKLLDDDDFVNEIISSVSSAYQNSEILNHDIVTIDTYPTLVITMKGQVERSGIRWNLILKIWSIFYEDKIVLLNCVCFNKKDFYSFEGLYDLITNSVIFPEQYY